MTMDSGGITSGTDITAEDVFATDQIEMHSATYGTSFTVNQLGNIYTAGTLSVTGASTLNGITNYGTLNNEGYSITNVNSVGAASLTTSAGASIGTTLGVTGASTLHGVTNSGGIDNSNSGITRAGAISGATTIDASGRATLSGGATISGAATTIYSGAGTSGSEMYVSGNDAGLVSASGSHSVVVNNTNTTITGTTVVNGNTTINGTTNVMGDGDTYAHATNAVQVSATGVDVKGVANTVTATTGSNSISANAASQSNTMSAIGTNGANYLTANATSGTNDLEAKYNSIGATTANSINTIGNAGTSTNTITGVANAMTATTGNTISANATSGTNDLEAKYNKIGATTANSINTIGNAGTSTNTITGLTNAMTATAANTMTAGTQNQLTGGTGNTITATTGNNTITAIAGSNSMSANAANQSNTVSAIGSNGVNYLTANATTGTNNVEAKNNNIGVATADSINTIGNVRTSINTITGAANAMTANQANTLTAGTQNQLTGGTGNTVTATTGNNTITATTGNNNISANAATGTNDLEAKYNKIGATTANSINTIGNAGTSSNTITGLANAMTATAANTMTAGTQNQLTGGTGNTITATTGNNTITATTGSNNISANAATGTNNVEAKNNNMGAATANSINTIGNAGTSANTITGAINNIINSDTYAHATSGIEVIAGGVDIKGAAFNVNTNSAVATTNSIGNTNVATTLSQYGGNGLMTLANNSVYMGVNAASAGRFQASASIAAMSAGAAAPVSGLANGFTTYSALQTVPDSGGLDNGSAASQALVRGAAYVNRLQGNTLVDGNMYINGTLSYTADTSAQTTVTGLSGGSILTPVGTTSGATTIINRGVSGTYASTDGNGNITMTNGTADQATTSLTLTNGVGNTHGIVVAETRTVLSGGTHSTTLTLDDNGGTFSNTSGAPVQVHGVADGTGDYDAVNMRQYRKLAQQAFAGIASAAALAAIPAPPAGENISVGMGYGNYRGENAMAVGLKGRVLENVTVTAGMGYGTTDSVVTPSAGFAFSF